mgnify:CR=1 FL=1
MSWHQKTLAQLSKLLINKDISALKVSKTIDQALLKKDKLQVNYLENEFIQWKHAIDQKLDIINSKDI